MITEDGLHQEGVYIGHNFGAFHSIGKFMLMLPTQYISLKLLNYFAR